MHRSMFVSALALMVGACCSQEPLVGGTFDTTTLLDVPNIVDVGDVLDVGPEAVFYRPVAEGWTTVAKVTATSDLATKIIYPEDGLGDWTISLWLRLSSEQLERDVHGDVLQFFGENSFPSAWMRIYTAGNPGVGDLEFSVAYADSGVLFDPIVTYVTVPPGERMLKADRWHHVAVTFEAGAELRLFLDGKMIDELDVSTWATANPGNGRTGAFDGANPAQLGFDGDLANVAIFDSTLTSGEVATITSGTPAQDLRETFGAWPGVTPSVYWYGPDEGGGVPNAGSGGPCTLGQAGYRLYSVPLAQ